MNARQKPFAAALPPEILDQAVLWVVRLSSGTATAADRAACEAWRAASPLHARAWGELQATEDSFRAAASAGPLAYAALDRASRQGRTDPGRRRALRLLAFGALGLGTGAIAHQLLRTERIVQVAAVGERRSVDLADGTRLQLNTGSEVEVAYSPLRRVIVLRRGEILLETGSDAGSPLGRRAFWVETAHARLEALGTRFAVRASRDATQLHVSEGAVAIHGGAGPQRIARPGETYLIAAAGAPEPAAVPGLDPAAWADGVLVAKRMLLSDFVAELARYRGAPLHCDPDAAALRVSGVFQLDGPDPVGRALDALARTLPVTVERGPGQTLTVARR